MTEQRTTEEIRYLTEDIGMPERYVELVLRDDDLWILDPPARFAWEPGEEDVAQWETAADFAVCLADGFSDSNAINHATRMLFWDLRDRAEEALRRARLRAAEQSTEGSAGDEAIIAHHKERSARGY